MDSAATADETVRLLFSCHNSQEVENFVPVAEAIEDRNRSVSIDFLSQDPIYRQDATEALSEHDVSTIDTDIYPYALEEPYAFVSALDKVRAMYHTASALQPLAAEYDLIVFGYDGIPMRAMAAAADRASVPTVQIVQGFLHQRPTLEPGLTNRVAHVTKGVARSQLLARLPRLGFLRRDQTTGRGHDGEIYVAGEHTKDTLVVSGVDPKRVTVTGVPRFRRLFERADEDLSVGGEQPFDVLYICSGYASHGLPTMAEVQQEQIERLSREAVERGIRFEVRPHPRSRGEWHRLVPDSDLVTISETSTDLYQSIMDSDVVVTINSTVAYEAALLGRPVILARFPEADCEWIADAPMADDFRVVTSPTMLFDLVEEIGTTQSVAQQVVQTGRENAYRVIDRNTPDSPETIATALLETIDTS
ncbi:hypothetical protein [Haloarcula sp. CGMCC 1.2071]|uniref:hypothetical protein n=1 Tax=Haloarcula sp. CGMCC 1.2071 TaxID=3111454 RepID=UPI00300E8AC3